MNNNEFIELPSVLGSFTGVYKMLYGLFIIFLPYIVVIAIVLIFDWKFFESKLLKYCIENYNKGVQVRKDEKEKELLK